VETEEKFDGKLFSEGIQTGLVRSRVTERGKMHKQ